MRSHSSLSLRIVIIRFLISWGVGILLRGSSFSSSSLLHRVFHRKAHSDAAIRKRRVASVLIFPLAPLIFRKGRAMIDVMWKPCGQGIEGRGLALFSSPRCVYSSVKLIVDGRRTKSGRLSLSVPLLLLFLPPFFSDNPRQGSELDREYPLVSAAVPVPLEYRLISTKKL